MKDSHVIQFTGMLFGIASVVFPYLALSLGRDRSTSLLFYIGECVALFIAVIGVVLSGISIRLAKANGDNKVKGVIGLVTSIVGIASCLSLVLLIGLILVIAWNM